MKPKRLSIQSSNDSQVKSKTKPAWLPNQGSVKTQVKAHINAQGDYQVKSRPKAWPTFKSRCGRNQVKVKCQSLSRLSSQRSMSRSTPKSNIKS